MKIDLANHSACVPDGRQPLLWRRVVRGSLRGRVHWWQVTKIGVDDRGGTPSEHECSPYLSAEPTPHDGTSDNGIFGTGSGCSRPYSHSPARLVYQAVNPHRSTIRRAPTFNALNFPGSSFMVDKINQRPSNMVSPCWTAIAERS